MDMALKVVLILCAVFVGKGVSENDKRILLSDPSYVQTQMDHMQSEIQDLIAKMNAQQTTISTQQTTIEDLHSKINTQQTTIQDHQAKINTQQTTIQDHQAKINTQQTTIQDLQAKINTQQTAIQDNQAKINTQQTTLQDNQAKINTQQTTISNMASSGKGVHFVRWGRMDCPGNYSLVYSGYAGGSDAGSRGAASEYVCMPPDPIWGPNKDKAVVGSGYIYGAEYENAGLFQMPNRMEDVPCAVCESAQYSTAMMIPGRTQCYPGWTEGYHGDLASGYYAHPASTQYVCVDQHPQALVGGGTLDSNGKYFYGVQSKCNPLKCPPYEDEKYLSCVVCLK